MNIVDLGDGFAIFGSICDVDPGDATGSEVCEWIREHVGPLPLIVSDPPYGNILPASWDRHPESDDAFMKWLLHGVMRCEDLALDGSALYLWGGIGKPGFRPFYKLLPTVESFTKYQLANHITWSKKRAYGVQHNYLFTREECAYFIKGDIKKPRCFHVPLLDQKRGYAGYNAAYPAKSEYLRRTNVWTDITELFRGKVHDAQKPEELATVMIKTHTEEGEWVLDPFGGSGSTAKAARALGRKFVVVENDPTEFQKMIDRLSFGGESWDS